MKFGSISFKPARYSTTLILACAFFCALGFAGYSTYNFFLGIEYPNNLGNPLRSIPLNSSQLAFSSDGSLLAVGGSGSITIVRTDTGKILKILKGHAAYIELLEFSPDGKWLLSAINPYELKDTPDEKSPSALLWNLKTFKAAKRLSTNDDITSGAFSDDGKRLATVNDKGAMLIWDTKSGKLLHKCQADKVQLEAVTYSFCQNCFISGNTDGIIRFWDEQTGKLIQTFPKNLKPDGADQTIALGVSDAHQTLVSLNRNDTVYFWDMQSGSIIKTVEGDQMRGTPKMTPKEISLSKALVGRKTDNT